MGKKRRSIHDIYRGIRKPVPPPERVEGDRRDKLRLEEDEKEIERHLGRRGGSGEEEHSG